MHVVSVNRSDKKGTIKTPVSQIELSSIGVEGDAHSGTWHRQVSLLAEESINTFSTKLGRVANYGEFAENITTCGVELHKLKPFDRLKFNDVLLEITQIGKKCHGEGCAIYSEVGNCVMPKEGIFARVIKGGTLKSGDVFTVVPKIYRCLVITMSDRASRGEYEDKSGPLLKKLVENFFTESGKLIEFDTTILPDDEEALLNAIVTSHKYDLIFTTGGTGIGKRDITPDIISGLLDKEIPGIMELIRVKYGVEKPNALLSRGVAGVRGNSLIFTLP
ncbi:MAG: hypothetical protein KBG80_11130, partial [Breznakibacter sp.]|nr:hypothetical protein [Breznakibacter sp.]